MIILQMLIVKRLKTINSYIFFLFFDFKCLKKSDHFYFNKQITNLHF